MKARENNDGSSIVCFFRENHSKLLYPATRKGRGSFAPIDRDLSPTPAAAEKRCIYKRTAVVYSAIVSVCGKVKVLL